MFFLQQIKNQFKLQLRSYGGPGETVADSEKLAPVADGPEASQTRPQEVADRASGVSGSLERSVDREVARGLIDDPHEANGNGAEVTAEDGSEVLVGDDSGDNVLVGDGEGSGVSMGEGGSPLETAEGEELTPEQTARREQLNSILEGDDYSDLTPEAVELLQAQFDAGEIEPLDGETQEEALQRVADEALASPEGLRAQGLTELADMSEGMETEMYSGLLEQYGQERLTAIADIYAEISQEEGFEAPETIEEFNQLMENHIAERERQGLELDDPDNPADTGALANAARQVLSGGSPRQLGSYSNSGGRVPGNPPELTPGNAEATRGQLDAAIREAPTEQAREMLSRAGDFLGKNETSHRAELQSFLGFDPTQTPWCKGFTNKCAEAAGIQLNSSGSLFSLSGVNDGRLLASNEQPLPGDHVMVRRNGGGHIGLFIGMSPNGHPIIIGGNQGSNGGGEVSIKEERRELVGISRVGGEQRNLVS